MKKSIIALTLTSLFCANAWAKVRTVSQDVATPAQYTTVAAAITASVAGDTIYIHGSVAQYPNFTVNKINLTFIGAGYAPVKDNPLATNLNVVYLDTTGNNQTGRGAKFIGLNIYNIAVGSNWGGSTAAKNKNVVVSRCRINYIAVSGDNWTITNNVIESYISIDSHASILVANNIFDNAYVNNSSQSSVIITNNLFYKGYCLSNVTNSSFNNNILFGTNVAYYTNNQNNVMNNNLTYAIFGITGSGETLPTANNSGASNITNTDPMFTYELSTGSTTFSLDYDFTLQAGSPAIGTANDSGDIGIYGGPYPWVDATGMSNLPFVDHLNISSVVPQNGNINVDVKAKRHK